MTASELSDEQRGVISKVEKLLRLAGKTTSEAEAKSATDKAMELLAAYNLTAAAVGQSDGDDGRRSEENLVGGHYEFEQDLMKRVAEINFCLCWNQAVWVDRPENEQRHAAVRAFRDPWKIRHVRRRQFRIVGRAVNVAATRVMYDYLRGTVERLTREYVSPGLRISEEETVVGISAALRSRRALSYREGVADRVGRRLYDRRREQLAEERRAAEELRERAERAAAERGAAGPTSTALTLSSLRQSEHDANVEHAFGYAPGTMARERAEREARARAAREAEAEYARWAAAHPEEARAEEKKRVAAEKAERKRYSGGPGSRGGTGRTRERDESAYSAGYAAGADVGIDAQAGGGSRGRGIGRTAGYLT